MVSHLEMLLLGIMITGHLRQGSWGIGFPLQMPLKFPDSRLWRGGVCLGNAIVGHTDYRPLKARLWRDGFWLGDAIVRYIECQAPEWWCLTRRCSCRAQGLQAIEGQALERVVTDLEMPLEGTGITGYWKPGSVEVVSKQDMLLLGTGIIGHWRPGSVWEISDLNMPL